MAQIKKDTTLRKSILQAAITGQLISDIGGESLPLAAAGKPSSATPSPRGYAPKTPNEFASFENQNSVSERSERPTLPETGKQLLDRIIEERNKKLLAEWEEVLKKNPKAKKPAPIVASEIDEEEIPFEIPENWCWCRLGDLISISSGDMLTSSQMKNGKIPVYGGNGITGYHNVSNIHEETIVIGRVGFYCGSVHLTEKEAWVTDNAFTTSYSKKCLNREYLIIALRQLDLGRQQNKTAQPVVSGKKIYPMLFPLPPLAVQNAIVETLEQVLPLVDVYENAIFQKEELKSALPDKVKKAILQEAITGKLTETWRKSATIKESGKQLLDRIIEERNAKALAEWEEALKKNVGGKATLPSFASKTRAKKPVPVVASEIDEEEIPFEVPESWCWCRLGDLAAIARGGSPRPINDFLTNDPDGYNWIKISDTDKGGKFINSTKQKIKKEGLYKTRLIHKGDFLLTNSMSFGRPYISNIEGCIHDGWLVFSFINELINPDFIYHLLSSPFIYDSFSQSAAGGVVQNLNTDKVIDTLVPLPPLEEQKEIVKKLEELLPLCK